VARRQRARILDAVVEVVAERGCAGASLGLVISRAKVSRRTFYELFAGLEDGLVAVMDKTLGQVSELSSQALEGDGSWQDGVRAALASVLTFFDSEPQLARVCIVEALAGGPVVLEHRERIVRAFRQLVVTRIESEVSHVSPLAAESVMASVMGVIHARLIAPERQPLIALLGPMMGTIVTPFVVDRQIAAVEVRRGDELARAIQAGELSWEPPRSAEAEPDAGDDEALPSMLSNPSARRARECMCFLVDHPGASNREVATGIGVTHQSQISKLLSDLLEAGLVVKDSGGLGRRNAWRLTPHGEGVSLFLRR
jgi:AcrR family transcriptional regulator